jgi:hypothetical protein
MSDDSNHRVNNNTLGGKPQGQQTDDWQHGGKDLLDAGLRAADRRWRIFPCKGDKTPLVDHWPQVATTDKLTIARWAKQYPGGLWGHALDADTVVIDLDIKRGKNGFARFEERQGCKADEFEAPKVATSSGGRHLYMRTEGREYKNTRDAIALGIDTRSLGGYVIIPSGPNSGYRWLTDPQSAAPPAPEWTETALRQEPGPGSNLDGPVEFQCSNPYGRSILQSACEAIADAPDGKQEITLNDRSYQIGRYVAGGLLDQVSTTQALIMSGLKMVDYDPTNEWTERQITKKVEAAIKAGKLKPLDGEEPFRATVELMDRYAKNPAMYDAVAEFLLSLGQATEPQPQEPPEVPDMKPQQPEGQGPGAEPSALPWKKVLVRRAGQSIPPPVPMCIDELIHEKGTGLFAGKYFGGKTFVAMSLAASLLTGEPWAGRNVLRGGGVLWLAAEGEWEVDLRIRAAVAALGYDPSNIPFYTQIANVPQILSRGGLNEVLDMVRQAAWMAKEEFGVPLALVVLDSMIKTAGYQKSESDSIDVNKLIMGMEDIAFLAKCFVLTLDHMGKDEGRGARGSSDKPSSVDVYAELKNGGTLHVIKVKGKKGHKQVDFEIVGRKQDGQDTAIVRYGEWRDQDKRHRDLAPDARLLLECIKHMLKEKGLMQTIGIDERVRCAHKKYIREEFTRQKRSTHHTTWSRAWNELVAAELITFFKNEDGEWVYLGDEID